ncbi:hypothetical protein HYV11_01570 [Candidatus Dependentiae bacterium]|nr:hypothetical protein [Candidatus Dependentiae bacterium]
MGDNHPVVAPAWHVFYERAVYCHLERFLMHCPSYQLFIMIHELTHAQQHMREGILRRVMMNNVSRVESECEADTNAAQKIKCPLCFKAVLAGELLKEKVATAQVIAYVKAMRYLMSDDLKIHLKQKIFD